MLPDPFGHPVPIPNPTVLDILSFRHNRKRPAGSHDVGAIQLTRSGFWVHTRFSGQDILW